MDDLYLDPHVYKITNLRYDISCNITKDFFYRLNFEEQTILNQTQDISKLLAEY